jgi:superfamily II DNA or RNA helicase
VIDTTANLIISKSNEVFLKINTEPHIEYELRDHFKFEVPNAKFMPQYRGRNWNGEIHLYDMRSKQIYVGLLDKIVSFCKNYGYTYKFEENKYYGTPYEENDGISFEGVKDYMNSICAHTPRKYQIEGVYGALKHNRKLLISPTASGKSLMIYSLVRYYVDRGEKIYSGREKTNDAPVTITTWQSVYKLERSFFEEYGCIIGDEAHLFKSKSLIQIMTKLHHAKYRFGFTGTLDGTQTHKWVLEGLFGPSYKVTRTDELMRQGHLSQLDIQCLVLKHPPQKFDVYEDEIQYLIGHEKRNRFIRNLTLDLKGNTLVLFARVEAHGAVLYEEINKNKRGDRKVFFIHGGVDAEEREIVREITERESNAIIVASYGTFSTGINIKNLHNVIFASPSKSRIRNLQSIGRVLRKGKDKVKATLYDIADDCSTKSRKNYTLNHFIERIKTYNEENFNYEIITIQLKV